MVKLEWSKGTGNKKYKVIIYDKGKKKQSNSGQSLTASIRIRHH